MYQYSNDFYDRKINKRNHLIKRVRQNYVRQDIPCGFSCCSNPIFDDFQIYVIPTKEVIEKHKSLLKSDFCKPIICQSIYLSLSSNDQKRLKNTINHIFFYDNFFTETVNKGINGVLNFYKSHLPDKHFIILSDVKEYPKYFNYDKQLIDLCEDIFIKEETNFEAYYENLEELYNNGKIYKTQMMTDTFNWRNGTVIINSSKVRILGLENMNRAINGDEVFVEIIKEPSYDLISDSEDNEDSRRVVQRRSIDSKTSVKKRVKKIDGSLESCNSEIMKNVENYYNNEIKENMVFEINKKRKDDNEILTDNENKSSLLFAKVVGIHKRNKTTLIGTIINNTVNGEGTQNVLVLPIDKKYPPVMIRTSQVEELMNKRLLVELEFWEQTSKYPTGHYFKKLNNIGDVEGEIECLLVSNGINYFKDKWINLFDNLSDPYDVETANMIKKYETTKCDKNNEILKSADTTLKYDNDNLKNANIAKDEDHLIGHDLDTNNNLLNNEYSDFFNINNLYKEVQNETRKDLRNLNIISIDPKGCTDVDDALHIKFLKNGNFEVGVHIADVSHYVKQDSRLDKIASDRATTVYLPDRRIDMLPEFLSAGLCSLLENQDRGAFSVVWEITDLGEIKSTEFFKSLIHSKKAFSYEEALKILESKESCKDNNCDNPSIYENIEQFSHKTNFFDNELLINNNLSINEKPQNKFLHFKKDLEALYKIATNLRNKRMENGALDLTSEKVELHNDKVIVKEHISTYTLIEEFMLLANISVARFIYENCPENSLLRRHPKPSEIDLPVKVDIQNSKDVNKIVSELNPEKAEIFKKILTRSMNQATYVLSSESTDFYHYGLATDMYTHFTSPIRRYADIIVHRMLYNILLKNRDCLERKHLYEGKSINSRVMSTGGNNNCNVLSSFVNIDEDAIGNKIRNEGNLKEEKFTDSKISNEKRHKLNNQNFNISQSLIDNLNKRHRNARRCSWDVNTLFVYLAVSKIEPVTFAYVTDLKDNGVLIYIPEYGINEALSTDRIFNVFDKIKIKIVKDDERFYLKRRFSIEVIE